MLRDLLSVVSVPADGPFAMLALLASLLLVPSCEESTTPVATHLDYYPLRPGSSWEYAVDSILYRETVPNDTNRWLVREELYERYIDGEGLEAWVIRRFRRPDEASGWQPAGTWTTRMSGGAERVEENLPYLKLSFPPLEGLSWNGHARMSGLAEIPVSEACNNFQFLEGWTYTYNDVHGTAQVGAFEFDSTVTVVQAGSQNLVEYNAGLEIYAKGVGQVLQVFEHYTTQTICAECPWEEKAECGYAVYKQLVAWD